ncbi:YgjV family protein [Azospirillum sp. sgz302134]
MSDLLFGNILSGDFLSSVGLAQAVGLAGTAAGMSWPLFRSRTGILLAQLLTCGAFAAHYALVGAVTGSVMNALATAQVLAAIPLGSRPGFRSVYLALLPVIAVAAVSTWNGLPSLFAALGFGFISLGRYQVALVPLRLFMALALPCWFVHNAMVWSVPGMISDVVGMSLNAVMLARLGGFGAARPTPVAEGAAGVLVPDRFGSLTDPGVGEEK